MENWRVGMLASVFVSANRKKGSRKPKPEDFMPIMKADQDEQTSDTHLKLAKSITENYNRMNPSTKQGKP